MDLSQSNFESLTEPGKILSLSFFRDDAAVAAWRNVEDHCRAQAVGGSEVFTNYRLRVASVIQDYGMQDHTQAPRDSREIVSTPSLAPGQAMGAHSAAVADRAD